MSWYDAVNYCNWRSKKEGLTPCYTINGTNVRCNFKANGYRLPTEAEWEYAARGGNKSKGYEYSGSSDPRDVGWYSSNSGSKTHPAGEKKANELGLHDMSGNVWEWCWDWYEKEYYRKSPKENPVGPSLGQSRVLRGGSWGNDVSIVRCSLRGYNIPSFAGGGLGFRIARTSF